MTFKKLALASAVAVVPAMGYSQMLEMADASMSDVTGQDGIQMDIQTPAAGIGANIYIHDKDGLGTAPPQASYSWEGAIVIENFKFFGNVNIDIDAADNAQAAGGAPTMQVNISIPTATIITGAIRVASSQRRDATPGWLIGTQTATLLNTMTIAMSGLSLKVQLGNEPQGNMIQVSSTVTGGITMDSFALNDAGGTLSGGAIGASRQVILDNGGTNLTLSVNADATTNGLVLNLAQVGSATGMDIRISDQYFGTTTAGIIGDITILGLNVNGTRVTISGK